MKTLILNGSPHAEKGNTAIFISHFMKGLQQPCEVRCIAREDAATLARLAADYDTVLVAMPLYVHAMPGIVMKLFEHMEPGCGAGRSIGFLVQSGFMEAAQSRFLLRYAQQLANRLGFRYLGCAVRGGAAGTYLMPEKANKELFALLERLGVQFEKTGGFDEAVLAKLGTPYELTEARAKKMELLHRMKIGDLFWYMMLKKHGAMRLRRDRPFAEKMV